MRVHPVRAFSDNYIWMLMDGEGHAVAVDPGDAAPVRAWLSKTGQKLAGILLTHHHFDHVGGVEELVRECGSPWVYGPHGDGIPAVAQNLREGDSIEVFGHSFAVLEVPGHTLDHIAYHCEREDMLLCGDTLFSAGCGRMFEGTAEQMHGSLSKLAALPKNTRVFCTHEYTLANLAFAKAVEPDNQELADWTRQAEQLRERDEPTLPSSIGRELDINPFLRVGEDAVVAAAQKRNAAQAGSGPVGVFAEIRAWKDEFRA